MSEQFEQSGKSVETDFDRHSRILANLGMPGKRQVPANTQTKLEA
jgi:hypothetical protein